MKKLVALLLSFCLLFGMLAVASADAETKTGAAQGFGSEVKVTVTVEDGKITALDVDDKGETYPVAREDSVEKVIAAIIEANGTEGVDVNTGATFTCTAVVNAVNAALAEAASKLGVRHHIGVSQSKDSFFGQHEPEVMPVDYELINKWNAWVKMGCLASEMESAALFIVGSLLRVRVGSLFLVMANQERAKAGLPNPVVHDTDGAIKTAIEAIRILMRQEKGNNYG